MICDEKVDRQSTGAKNGTGNVRICCMGERCGYAGFRSGVSCCEIGFFNVISFSKPQSFALAAAASRCSTILKSIFGAKQSLR